MEIESSEQPLTEQQIRDGLISIFSNPDIHPATFMESIGVDPRRIANYNLTRQSPATISSIAFTLASEQGIFEPEAAIGKLQVKIREELAEIDYRKNLQEQGIIPPVGEIASYSLSDLGLEQPTDHTQAKQTLIEVVNKLRRRGMTPVLTAGSISDDFFIVAERVR